MAHMMKKEEFLNLIKKCEFAQLKTRHGSVYLYDREIQVAEVYRASNMQETGIICALNQSMKYRKWMG